MKNCTENVEKGRKVKSWQMRIDALISCNIWVVLDHLFSFSSSWKKFKISSSSSSSPWFWLIKQLRAYILSLHDDVRRREQHRDRRDHREQGEGDETESIDYHRGEFPIHDDLLFFVADLHPVGDELELLEDALQLPVGRGRAGMGVAQRRWRRARARPAPAAGVRRGGGHRGSRAHDVFVGLERIAVDPHEGWIGCGSWLNAVAASGHWHRSEK